MGWRLSGIAGLLFVALSFLAAGTISGAGIGGVALLGSSWVILRTGVFHRRLGWIGVLAGAAAIASTGAIVEGDPGGAFAKLNSIAWLVYFLWMAALSVEMIRGAGRTQA